MTVPSDVGSVNLNNQKTSTSEESKPQFQKQGVAVLQEASNTGQEKSEKEELLRQEEFVPKQAPIQQQQQQQQQQSSSYSNGSSYPRRDFNSKRRNFPPNNRYNSNYNPRRTNHTNRFYSNNNLSRYHNSNDGNTDNLPPNYPYFYYYPPPNMYYPHTPMHQQPYPSHPPQLSPPARRSYSDNTNFRAFRNEQKNSSKAAELLSEDDDDSDKRDDDDLEIIVHDDSLTNSHLQTKRSPSSGSNDANKPFDLKKQLEYYFSRQNLVNDTYLVSQMDEDLYVPISVIANFKRVREHTNGDINVIVNALKELTTVTVDDSGTKVKPNASLQTKRNTVIFRDVPECTEEEMEQLLKDLNSPTVQSMRKDFGNMWYFTFETEEDALALLTVVRGKDFKDQPIAARMKSEPVIRVQARTNNPQDIPRTDTSDNSTSPLNYQHLPFSPSPPANNSQYAYPQYAYHQGPPHKRHFSPRRQQYQPSYPRYDNTSHFSNRNYERGSYQNRNRFPQLPSEGSKNPSSRSKYNNNQNPKYMPRDDNQQQQQEHQEQSVSSASSSLLTQPHASTSYSERRPYNQRYNNTNNYKYNNNNNNRHYNHNNNKYDNDQRQPFRQSRAVDRSMMTDDIKNYSSPSPSPKAQSSNSEMTPQQTDKEPAQRPTETISDKESLREKPVTTKAFKEQSKLSEQADQTTVKELPTGRGENATQKTEQSQASLALKGTEQQRKLLPRTDEQSGTSPEANAYRNRGSTKPDTGRRRSSNSTVVSSSSISQLNADSSVETSNNRKKKFGKYNKYKPENRRQENEEEEEVKQKKKQPQPEVDLQPAHFPPLPNQQPSSSNSAAASAATTLSKPVLPAAQTRSVADVVKASMNRAIKGDTSIGTTSDKESLQKDKSPNEQRESRQKKKETDGKKTTTTPPIEQNPQASKDRVTVSGQKENAKEKKDTEGKDSSDNNERSKKPIVSVAPATVASDELKLKTSFSWADMLKEK